MRIDDVILLCENQYIKRIDNVIERMISIINEMHQGMYNMGSARDSTVPEILWWLHRLSDYRPLSTIDEERMYTFMLYNTVLFIQGKEEVTDYKEQYQEFIRSNTLPKFCEKFIKAMGDLGIDGTIDIRYDDVGKGRVVFDFSSMSEDIQRVVDIKLRYNQNVSKLRNNIDTLDEWREDCYHDVLDNIKSRFTTIRLYDNDLDTIIAGNVIKAIINWDYEIESQLSFAYLTLPSEFEYNPRLTEPSAKYFFECIFKHYVKRLSIDCRVKVKNDSANNKITIELLFNRRKFSKEMLYVSK